MITCDAESYQVEVLEPLESEVAKTQLYISELHEELSGGFYYDALPDAEAEVKRLEEEILVAKADIEMVEYDSDDIDEISSSISKGKRKFFEY